MIQSGVRSAFLDFYDSVDGKEECCESQGEAAGDRRGWSRARGGKSGRRGEGERVTSRGSHQRLFCGFDSHWLAGDGHLPHPSSFRRYSPPSSYLFSLSRARIPTLGCPLSRSRGA